MRDPSDRGNPRVAPRHFEVLPGWEARGVVVPQRQTGRAAGYDLAAAESVRLAPGQVAMVPTGLCVRLPPDEFLAIYVRSGVAVRRGLVLANGVAVIDADYIDSPGGGHILIALRNIGGAVADVGAGERIAQGIFQPYRLADGDAASGARDGGFGSTGT